MIIPPIDPPTQFTRVQSPAGLFQFPCDTAYFADMLHGIRSHDDQRMVSAEYLSIPDGIVIVGDREIFYVTADWKYIPNLYPKSWPYAKHLAADGRSLSLDLECLPKHRLHGTFFMPFNVAGNWFHMLFDNYARLYHLGCLHADIALSIGIPFWGYPDAIAACSDRAMIHSLFLEGLQTERLEKGVYQIDRVIAPPLGNAADYIFAEPARFVSKKLQEGLVSRQFTHQQRIFVSRADIPVRNIVNEADLAAELQRLGFIILCPGDYSLRCQFELFASADIIVGVHGQGLIPMICARKCRALMEFEAAGWSYTTYSSIAEIMGMSYHKLPCEMLEYRNPGRFDWLAKVDVGKCVAMIERAL